MTVRSKMLVLPSTGRKIFVYVLYIAVIVLAITAIAGFFASGFQLSVLLSCTAGAVIVQRFTNEEKNRVHYEFALVDIRTEGQALTLHYHVGKQVQTLVSIPFHVVKGMEYSDQLCCIRLLFRQRVPESSNGDFHLLYVEKELSGSIISYLQRELGQRVVYMDR